MPFSYVVYPEHRLVISTGSDRVTWEEIKHRQDQTKTDPDFNPEFNQIVDLRTVTGFDMSSGETRMLAHRSFFCYLEARFCCGQSERFRGGANVGNLHRIVG